MFQLSDTPTSAVKFFYLHETRESSCSVRSITVGGCSTRGVSESWKQSDNEKGLAIVHRWVIDREPLNSEYHSGCPLRHKLFDCEFIIALSRKSAQACTPVHKLKVDQARTSLVLLTVPHESNLYQTSCRSLFVYDDHHLRCHCGTQKLLNIEVVNDQAGFFPSCTSRPVFSHQ